MTEKLPVLLVEDDVNLREGLQEYLTLSGFNVKSAGNGVDCMNLASSESFSVAVIDLGLPDISGHQLVDYLRRCHTTAVIVLTASNTLDIRVQSYQSGADLFMSKPVDVRELVAAITSLASRRNTTQAPSPVTVTVTAAYGGWQLQPAQWKLVSPGGVAISFTAKEFELIEFLVAEAGKSVSREQLCMSMYGRTDQSAQAALSTLVKRVRQTANELGIDDQIILTDHGIGYRFAYA